MLAIIHVLMSNQNTITVGLKGASLKDHVASHYIGIRTLHKTIVANNCWYPVNDWLLLFATFTLCCCRASLHINAHKTTEPKKSIYFLVLNSPNYSTAAK